MPDRSTLKVVSLFIRRAFSAEMIGQEVLDTEKGRGILGDRHWSKGFESPRQVLMISNAVIERHDLRPADLEPNIVMTGPLEKLRSGDVLHFGPGSARLHVTIPCDPCATLEKIRRGLARQLMGKRGTLARVVRSGPISRWSSIRIESNRYPALASSARERFYDFVQTIPAGRVTKLTEAAKVVGVTAGFCRAMPGWVKRGPAGLPYHRLVRGDGSRLAAGDGARGVPRFSAVDYWEAFYLA